MFDLSLPGAVEQVIPAGQPLASPALAGKTTLAGKPTAYACLGPQCSLPVTEPAALLELLRKQRGGVGRAKAGLGLTASESQNETPYFLSLARLAGHAQIRAARRTLEGAADNVRGSGT